MTKKSLPKIIGIFGFSILIISLIAAFNKVNNWYFLAVVGAWLFFDYLASNKTDKTALQLLIKDKKKFIKLYFLIFLLGCGIELIGRFIFNLWYYPLIKSPLFEIILLIYYPLILFSLREMYVFLDYSIRKKIISFITAVLLGILIWEIPNYFSKDWIYTIPIYSSLEILDLHLIVIVGWSILIALPYYIYGTLGLNKNPN